MSNLKLEPVAFTAALTTLFGSVLALLRVFAIVHWTADEVTAVATVWAAVMAMVLLVPVRNAVTPVAGASSTPVAAVPDAAVAGTPPKA